MKLTILLSTLVAAFPRLVEATPDNGNETALAIIGSALFVGAIIVCWLIYIKTFIVPFMMGGEIRTIDNITQEESRGVYVIHEEDPPLPPTDNNIHRPHAVSER